MSDIALKDSHPVKKESPFHQYGTLLYQYLRPQRAGVLWMAALLLASIALQLASPQVIRYFLDTAQAGAAVQTLRSAALVFIAFAIGQQVLSLAANYTSQNVGWRATNRLRADLALHCLRLDMPFHKRHTPGELIERIDGDVTRLANFFSAFAIRLLGNALLVMGILVLLFRESAWVGAGMLVYTLLSLLAMSFIQRLALPHWTAERQSAAELYGYMEERISGAEELRAAGAEAYAMRRLYERLRDFLHKRRTAFVVSSLAYTSTNLVYVIGYAAGLALGVYLFMQGQASLGTAYLIVHYVGMLSDPLQNIREQAEDLQKSSASVLRIRELFALRPAVSDPALAQPAVYITAINGAAIDGAAIDGAAAALPEGALGVRFDNVVFAYNDSEGPTQNGTVLKDISFAVQPGRVVGILGRTGSGKSTLTRLLFRLYDPTAGRVMLNDIDLRQLSLAELRARVGMVTQDVQLFNASVRDNLTFFNTRIPDQRLMDVLKALGLWGWVQGLPDGLDTRLAAGGQGLSAGEAQLLAFARVFLKNPGLVILDEASSRLDPATETRMERAIDGLFAAQRTGLIIAHRLKTVQRADDILILDDGRVLEYGPREALARDPHSRFAALLRTGLEEALA